MKASPGEARQKTGEIREPLKELDFDSTQQATGGIDPIGFDSVI
jgi:hypothetical protein